MQQEITRVALDAMGGDNAPGELVKGCCEWQIGHQGAIGRTAGCG